jgi:hypothetical protein
MGPKKILLNNNTYVYEPKPPSKFVGNLYEYEPNENKITKNNITLNLKLKTSNIENQTS